MSVTLRPYRSGGWEVDITIRLPDGSQYRERKRASRFSKSAAQRWAQDRERYLLQHGPPTANREVPTLEAFAPRFVDGHARANRHKPSGIATIESILKWHLVPTLGPKRLDAITNEQVQRLKLALAERAPKTVNNVLTVLSTLLKKAVEWGELERLPCAIKLLPNPKKTMGFHDFDQYERLLTVARKRGTDAYLMVLAGGDAGLRLGEIIALEWRDIDLAARRLDRGAIRLARTRHGTERRTVTAAPADPATDGGAQGRSASPRRARVVPAGRIADHARSRDQSRSRRSAHRGYRAGRAHPAAHVLFRLRGCAATADKSRRSDEAPARLANDFEKQTSAASEPTRCTFAASQLRRTRRSGALGPAPRQGSGRPEHCRWTRATA